MSDADLRRLERELARQGRSYAVVDLAHTDHLWAVALPGRTSRKRPGIILPTVSLTRTSAIAKFIGADGWIDLEVWKRYRDMGHRAVRIRVFEEARSPPGAS